MHQATVGATCCNDTSHLGIGTQSAYVVDKRCAGANRGLRHGCLRGIDRDLRRGDSPRQTLDHRHDPAQLLLHIDGLSSWARRFAADVEDIRSLLDKLDAMSYGGLLVQEQAAIRERVGGHVEDPHQAVPRTHTLQLLTVV